MALHPTTLLLHAPLINITTYHIAGRLVGDVIDTVIIVPRDQVDTEGMRRNNFYLLDIVGIANVKDAIQSFIDHEVNKYIGQTVDEINNG